MQQLLEGRRKNMGSLVVNTLRVLVEVVGATDLDDEKQKETFDMLLGLVDSHKLAAFIRELATKPAAPSPSATVEDPADTAAEGQEYLWSPEEEVPWSRVMAAVPDEAAALEAVLAAAKLTMAEFCHWCDGDYELCDESGDLPDEQDLPVDELLGAAWDHLSRHFERVTGLRLYTYCRYRRQFGDPDTGFEVVGAWQRSPAGKRFFGIESKEQA
jgi:hypothetical protein